MSHVGAREMRAIEEAAFLRGVDPGELMDRAGEGIAARLLDHFPLPGTAIAYLGKGNNAGDALVALEILQRAGWQIALRSAHPESEWSPLSRARLDRLGMPPREVPPHPARPLLLLDGLLGIGAKGPLRPPLSVLAEEMRELRQSHGAIIAAMDLPSGLDSDSGELHAGGVIADLNLTVGIPKSGLLTDSAAGATGRLFLIPLDDLPIPDRPGLQLITPATIHGLLPPRPHQFHKGDAGRVAILAGSEGMSGAAALTSTAALHAGAGLVTLHLGPDTSISTPPEIMVTRSPDRVREAFTTRADARIIGPGLGKADDTTRKSLLDHLADNDLPTILDADALNWIAEAKRLDLLGSQYLITPHPGEFSRLAPDLADLPRAEAAARFVERHPCTLLLKGARTLIASPDEEMRINSTGHAGMASGGQGDVLAGVCGALLASGHTPMDAATLAAWLCGRAAERAITYGDESPESTTATHTISNLGGAFTDWRERRR
ncbi:NAD(P)H-hydrate dehydratase [Haloferula chungangensis]|uniref:ADP-dependent (S)-NAD(P)H-hydrate dehydratase n=1 Tax=Haloferula chungangensis TaxID=1048331 RepID=A0ABW2LCW0_9BACT